jgi:hypothetical protein
MNKKRPIPGVVEEKKRDPYQRLRMNENRPIPEVEDE